MVKCDMTLSGVYIFLITDVYYTIKILFAN